MKWTVPVRITIEAETDREAERRISGMLASEKLYRIEYSISKPIPYKETADDRERVRAGE